MEDSTLTLERTTFNGTSSAKDGGAIFADSGSTISAEDCVFQANNASHYGGSIYLNNGTSARITNSTFSKSRSLHGGAIFAFSSGLANLVIEDCKFEENLAESGGAVSSLGLQFEISGSSFIKNEASLFGGAMSLNVGIRDAELKPNEHEIVNCLFQNNKASSGGGIVLNQIFLHIKRSTFFQNSVESDGGAFFIATNSRVECEDTVLRENRAYVGGAFSILSDLEYTESSIENKTDITFIMDRSTCRQNIAIQFGGCFSAVSDITINITQSIIDANSAYDGGGGGYFVNIRSLNLTDVIFKNNKAESVQGIGGGFAVYSSPVNAPRFGISFEGRVEVTMKGCVFRKNVATSIGGAMVLMKSVSATIDDSLFEFNSANNISGAIHLLGYIPEVELRETDYPSTERRRSVTREILEEARSSLGSPIYADAASVSPVLTVIMTNTTVRSNRAYEVAGITALTDTLIWVRNCTFAKNKASDNSGALYFLRSMLFSEHSLFYKNSAGVNSGAITFHVRFNKSSCFTFVSGRFIDWIWVSPYRRQFPRHKVP